MTAAYRRILVAHDGSDLASAAVTHAAGLARMSGAGILLLRVTETAGQTLAKLGGGWPPAGSEVVVEAAVEETRRRDAEAVARLDDVRQELRRLGVPQVSVEVVEGIPGEVIVATAGREGCDLIVMATHGRSGLGRALLGSVADHVTRYAAVPVFLVRPTPVRSTPVRPTEAASA